MPLSAEESKNSDSAPSGAALMHIEGPRAGKGLALAEPVNGIGRGADNTVVLADEGRWQWSNPADEQSGLGSNAFLVTVIER